MDVLIMPTGIQVTSEQGIAVQFRCATVKPNGEVINFAFQVPYVYGATVAQKRAAIIAAAKVTYQNLYDDNVPEEGLNIEVIGIA